jgi:hypothetical protein
MEVWSEASFERGRKAVVLKSLLEKGWLGCLISRRSRCQKEVSGDGSIPKYGEWTSQIQALIEECDALRRRIHLSS